MRKLTKQSLTVGAFLATTALAAPAFAQVYTPPALPPIRQTVDPNGVDLPSGALLAGTHGVSIGPAGAAGMSWSRTLMGDGSWRDSTEIILWVSGSTYTLSNGNGSESFTLSGANYISNQKTGSTLTVSGSTYTYTTRDGTAYTLLPWASGDRTQYQGSYRVSTITYPTGEKLTFNWEIASGICIWNEKYMFCGRVDGERLRSVTSTNGYQLQFTFAVEDPSSVDGPTPGWAAIHTVAAQNMSVNPASQSWPTLTFTGLAFSTPITVTDSLSRTTTYNYTTSGGLLTNVQRPGASSPNETVGWNTSSMVTYLSNNGVATNYAYSDVGSTRTTTVTDALSHNRVVTTDLTTMLVSSDTDEAGRKTSYTYYSGSGLRNTVTAPEGNYATFAYDGRGNLTQTTLNPKPGSPLSPIVTSATYPASDPVNTWQCASGTPAVTCNKPLTTTDANGNVTNYAWNSSTGLPTSVTSPAPSPGAVQPQTRYSYSSVYGQYLSGGSLVNFATPLTRLTGISQCQTTASCTGSADEAKTSISYGTANALPVSVSSGSGDGSLTATSALAWDTIGNKLTIDGPLPGTADTTRYRYDADREPIGTTSPNPGNGQPDRATRITYNADGQVTKQEAGTVTDQSDAAWANFATLMEADTSYDSNARPVTQAMASGGTTYALTQASYDALGRTDCTAVRMNTAVYGSLPASACTLSTQGSYGPDQISETLYDAAGEVTDNLVGVGTAAAATERHIAYNPNSTVASLTDASSNVTSYTYDGFDRTIKISYPGASTEQVTAYDNNGNVLDAVNRAGQTIVYSYDALNRVTAKGGAATAGNYSYDNLGRMTAASQPGVYGLSFVYDALGRQTSASGSLGTNSSQYDIAGRRTHLSTSQGLILNYQYLTTGEMSSILDTNNATLASFGYDALGNRISLTGNGTVTSYGYDPVSRLSSLTHDLAGTANDLNKTFAYNPASQISSETRSNDSYAWNGAVNVNRGYTPNTLNQYTAAGSANFTYDANGNLTSDGTNSFAYDAENHMTSATVGGVTTTLSYDPLGRLYQISNGSTVRKFISDGSNIISEVTANAVVANYAFGPGSDEPLVWWDGNSGFAQRWLHADERGSIVALSDSNGNAVAINSYDEYGIPGSGNSTSERFQYTGQMYLSEIGMYYYKARMYSTTLGRFMQTDPIGYGDGMNWYAYTHNDPVNYVDPTGLAQVRSCITNPDGSQRCWVWDEPDVVVTGNCGALLCTVTHPSGPGGSFTLITPGSTGGITAPPPPPPAEKKLGQCLVRFLTTADPSVNWANVALTDGAPFGNNYTTWSETQIAIPSDNFASPSFFILFHEFGHVHDYVNRNFNLGFYVGSTVIAGMEHPIAAVHGESGLHDYISWEKSADAYRQDLIAKYNAAHNPCGALPGISH